MAARHKPKLCYLEALRSMPEIPHGCTDGSGHLLETDQRGQSRPDKEETGGCDMGAYESQSD